MSEINSLPGSLEAWAERAPHAIALRHKVRDVWRTRTWRELNDEVTAVSAGLAALGFERGDAVWIAVDVRPEALIVALAAQQLGGAAIVSAASSEGPRESGTVAATRATVRFAFVRDGSAARRLAGEATVVTGARLIYLETRGSWISGDDVCTYPALCAQGRARGAAPLAAASADSAVIVAPSASRLSALHGSSQHTHAALLTAARTTAARANTGSEHDLFASDVSDDLLLTRLLPLWLVAGLRLNFAEDAPTTADYDRRELGPSLLAATQATLERLEQRVLENLPVAARGAPWAGWTRRAVRDVLGLTRVKQALVAEPLEPAQAQFVAALGLTPVVIEAPHAGLERDLEPPAVREHALHARPAALHAASAKVTELAPRARDPLLSLVNISLAFNEIKAINDISFAVAPHEVCALIGPNGAGKSSLLNVINGIYRPQRGQIQFAGQVHTSMTPRAAAKAGIARTFQNLAIFKGMTVLANVIVGRNLSASSTWLEQALWVGRARQNESESRERAEEILEFLRIQRYRHVLAAQLPYGLQKRVELARALVAQPRLLLLDEPMAGMNADEKRELSELILDVNRELGTTVVLIEHDMRVVMDISDHVVVLDYGRLVGDGTPAEVRNDPEVLRAYLGRRRVA